MRKKESFSLIKTFLIALVILPISDTRVCWFGIHCAESSLAETFPELRPSQCQKTEKVTSNNTCCIDTVNIFQN
jgi:hypothetical protein